MSEHKNLDDGHYNAVERAQLYRLEAAGTGEISITSAKRFKQARHDVRAGVDPRLLDYADDNGVLITAGKNGVHNKGSKHYIGAAIDISSRIKRNGAPMTEAYWGHCKRDASRRGLKFIDERTRPPGQKVWTGPHGHVQL